MNIRIKADTVEVSRNVNREVVDMQLIFTEHPNTELQIYVTEDIVEDMLRQIKDARAREEETR